MVVTRGNDKIDSCLKGIEVTKAEKELLNSDVIYEVIIYVKILK